MEEIVALGQVKNPGRLPHGQRTRPSALKYLVRFRVFDSSHDEWTAQGDLSHYQDAIAKYHQKVGSLFREEGGEGNVTIELRLRERNTHCVTAGDR